MSGRPVRRRVLADVARSGGWQTVLARIASGEPVAAIARSFGVTRGFFSALLHEDRDRHAMVARARQLASGREPLAEIAALLGGFARPVALTAAGAVEAREVEP
jgi:hypothetical protein